MNISIKNRIHWSFAVLMIIFVVNGIVTITTLRYDKKLSSHISEVTDPSLQSLFDLRKSILQSRMFATNWVFLRYDQESKANLKALQDSTFPALKTKLIALSANWYHQSMVDSLKKLITGFERMLLKEKPIMTSLQKFEDYDNLVKKLGAEEQLENEIIPNSLTLMDLLNSILKHELKVRLEEQNKLESASLFLQMLIIILAVTIICMGIFLSVYLSNIIIKPVNIMGAIVSDLGKGIIRRMNSNERNDEIGDMIKSVNRLSENLFAMRTFAQQVGSRIFEANYQPLSEEDILGKALVSMRDGLRDGERELLKAHFQMETLFKKMDDVFFSMDMVECKILQMSPACEKVYGYHSSEFMINPMLWFELTLEEDRKIIEANDSIMKAGKSFQHESRIRHKDNSIHWIETKITPTLNVSGVLVRIDGIVSDITYRKEAEELLHTKNAELMKSNLELDKFVYSVSHDLRAPLLSMLGVVNIAKEEATDDGLIENLNLMENCIKRLDNFIRDILDYSRNSKSEVRKEKINFNEVLNAVTKNLKYISGSRKIDIKLNVDDSKPFICDKDRISVILNNLISNAVWYQNPLIDNPLVDVMIDMSDTETNIVVRDNGIGISKENQPRIFEMFYRVSKKSVGSGLGLYIVKEILDKLNGSIEVESEIGKGSIFNIHIPN